MRTLFCHPGQRYEARRAAWLFGGLACIVLLTGCAKVGRLIDPFNVLTPDRQLVRIGITRLDLSPLLLPKALLFEENLTFELGSPVSFDLMTPRQIRLHLGTGRLKFALLTPAEYCVVSRRDVASALAVPLNEHRQTSSRGLIVVPAKSPVNSLVDLKGYRFHFLVKGHALNDAALGALLDAGVTRADLDKGLLRLELDQYHISSMEVARSVVIGERSAGVIHEADYARWPASGGSLLLFTASKDQVKVIGETVRVPAGPFVVSHETDPELARKVGNYLVEVLPKRPLVLASLGYSGFVAPLDPQEYEPFKAMYDRLHPEPAEPTTEPASEPAPGD